MSNRCVSLFFVATLAWVPCAGAEPPAPRARSAADELLLIETTERDEDPLGLDESTGQALDEAADAVQKRRAEPVLPSANTGQVLNAIAAVSETAHELRVRFEQGLVFVTVRASFASTSPHPAELATRIPLPEGATPLRVRACSGERCTDASPNAEDSGSGYAEARARPLAKPGSPVLEARVIQDARGRALSVRAAPIADRAPIALELDYAAEAKVRANRARFTVPARGEDPRAAETTFEVSSLYGASPLPGTAFSSDPALPVELIAPLGPRAARSNVSAPCGARPCRRSFAVQPARASAASKPRPVWLLLDASPSMEGPARGRVDAVLAVLLANLRANTEVRALSFGAGARALGTWPAHEAPLATLSSALLDDLGASTRPSSALALLGGELARERPRVVIVSDGQFDRAPAERRALEVARRRGAEVWLVSVAGDRPARHVDALEGVLSAAELADGVLRGERFDALADALHAIEAEPLPHGARRGEQLVRESEPPALELTRTSPWLAFWLSRHRPPPGWFGGSAAGSPIPAPAFLATPPNAAQSDTGMPKESVLNLLRTQLVPRARACLRSDRKGRGDYAVAITFHALFERREVSEVAVEGDIPHALRACLTDLLPTLRVPSFSGRVRVRYPIHTEREPLAPVIELEPDLAEQVDRVIRGGEGGRPAADSPARGAPGPEGRPVVR